MPIDLWISMFACSMCPFLFWRSEKHSSHDSGRSKETRPSWTRSFQFSVHLTFTHIPLAKLSHKIKPHINMEMLGEGGKYLLNDNHSQLMIMFYFNCQPNKSLCLTHALCLLSCDKGSAVSKSHPPECPGSSLFWLLQVASLHHQFFLLSWVTPNSRHADQLPHQNIVLL